MNIKSLLSNRAVQYGFGAVAGLMVLSMIFGSVMAALIKIAFFSAIGYGAYMGYKHVFKPWKSERDLNARIKSNNPNAYNAQEVQRQVAQAMKKNRR